MSHFEGGWNSLPGIHTIMFGDDQAPIDIYVNEYVKDDVHDVQPVFFTGAVSKREDKKGPFFSGLGITHNRNLPLISVADPSLDVDLSLSLSWYTGGPEDHFVSNLNRLLESIQQTQNRELLFVGGSGGGFAALKMGSIFNGSCSVLVWNPQTDIYEYAERFVKIFLKSRFNFAHSSLSRSDWKDFCRIRTDSKISTNVLVEETIKNPRRVAYLQNSGDWHRAQHLTPLWRKVSESPLSDGANSIDQDHVIYIKEFAEGHAPPSSQLIGSLLNQLMSKSFAVQGLNFNV